MFPQAQFSEEMIDRRLEDAARSRLVSASSRRHRRTSRRGLLRRLAAGFAATLSADQTTGHSAVRFPGRQV